MTPPMVDIASERDGGGQRWPRRGFVGVIAAVGGVALSFGLITAGCGGEPPTPGVQIADEAAIADYQYTIPAGTGARLDDGQRFEILPEELEVRVGETIEIVNDDERGHVIGVFYVGPNETLRQTFTEAGTLIGECSIHPSGSFGLTVTA